MPRGKAKPYTLWAKRDLTEAGFKVIDDTERKNCWSGTKNDLFGFGDLLALRKGPTPAMGRRLIVQVTARASNHSLRKKKILGIPVAGKLQCKDTPLRAYYSLLCGMEICIMSYTKVKGRWQHVIEGITLQDFPKWVVSKVTRL